MPKPKRRSLSDRTAAAIAAPDHAEPDPPTEQELPPSDPPATKEPATAAPAPVKASASAALSAIPSGPGPEIGRRTSVYLASHALRDARSAYLVDHDTRTDSPDTFSRWAAAAIVEFAALSVEDRQQVRVELGAQASGVTKPQQIVLPEEVDQAVDDAMRADLLAGCRDRSQNVFHGYALRWATEQTRQRAGLKELPEPPDRLPSLYRR